MGRGWTGRTADAPCRDSFPLTGIMRDAIRNGDGRVLMATWPEGPARDGGTPVRSAHGGNRTRRCMGTGVAFGRVFLPPACATRYARDRRPPDVASGASGADTAAYHRGNW